MNHKFLKPRQALNKAFLNMNLLTGIILQMNEIANELLGLEEEIRIVEGGEG